MWPLILRVIRNYIPMITLPFAAVIGVVGYNLENILSDKHTPSIESTKTKREKRLLTELKEAELNPLKERKFVPETIFERNVSPSLRKGVEPEVKKLWQ